MISTNSFVGIDLVEIDDIRKRIHRDKFIHRILSVEELALLSHITDEEQRLRFIAGRFAAKEAYVKAYKQFETPLNFTDVRVLKDDVGTPYIVSSYRPDDSLDVSISHTTNYAVAIVIIKKTP